MSKGPIPRAALDQNAITLGKTRSGKSSAMRFLIEGVLDDGKVPLCIIDPKGDWWGIKLAADGRSAGYPLIIFGASDNPRADIHINANSGGYIAELIATGNRSCLINLGGWRHKERTSFFIEFAATLFKLISHPLYLVIDECHNFVPKGKIFSPDVGEMLHWGNRLASEGLGKGIMLLSASQRPQKVHNDYLTSHETLIAKKVIHKADRDAIKDWIDGCGDPALGKEIIASIAQLQKPEAWCWSPEIGFGPKRIDLPLFKTYDSFKPQTALALGKLKGWASVNLDEVRAKLSKVVEEVKENDPKALKALVAQLSGELAKRSSAPAPVSVSDRKYIEAAVELGQQEGRAIGREEGFLVGHHVGAGLYRIALKWSQDQAEAKVKDFRAALLGSIGEGDGICSAQEFTQETAGFTKIGGDAILAKLKKKGQNPATSAAAKTTAAIAYAKKPGPIVLVPKGRDPKAPVIGPDLGRAKQQILDVMAWWEAIGSASGDKNTIAFLAGVSPNSSGHQNNMGSLRSSGLIEYPGPGLAILTQDGRARANPPDAPLNSEALQSAVLAKLNPPMRAILEKLLEDNKVWTKADLADALSVSANSSGHQNNLGRLRSLGFIKYPAGGQVQVADSMFI